MPTVAETFASKNLWAWFNSNPTKTYDGSTEKGIDYSTTFGTPVGVVVPGQVKRITPNNNSIGDIVEIQDASGGVWLYQHITSKVQVGQSVQVGSIVGTENGLPIDAYSTGPHIEVRYAPAGWSASSDPWLQPWINPASVFSALGGQQAGTVAQSGLKTLLTNLTGGGNPNQRIVHIAPNADVTALLWALDQVLALTNPFNVTTAATEAINVAGISVQFTDPVGWVEGFGINIVDDLAALVARLIFLVIGVMVILKVMNNFIDLGAIGETIAGGVETIAGGAALLV